jgi:hydrogenase maturation protein HypF
MSGTRTSHRLEVHGTVQGVGFRPFVYRLATSLGLDGTVRNAGGTVVVDTAGAPAAVDALAARLRTEAPPLARVVTVTVAPAPRPWPKAGSGFAVVASDAAASASRDIPPDVATCDACLRELFDPRDRRHRYPFVNCTDCGPRATIIDDLPYDRVRTAMSGFPMCPACAAEYADPADRRFHAEPIACPACGPRLAWRPGAAAPPSEHGDDALRAAVAAVATGGIVALKGLGGYQLVCDASDHRAVEHLRAGKRRPAKPFAVMVGDAAAARRLAEISAVEAALLRSPARPIVLLRALPSTLAPGIHPGVRDLGLFLPYTPLHHLLLHDLDRPLVVTSGNRSEEPIAIDDDQALERLGGIAGGFLQHDRPIRARYDDSVARVVHDRQVVVRRARGCAPAQVPLPLGAPEPLLALGAELKHTFTLAVGGRAVVGPHTGDLEDADTFAAFERNLAHLCRVEGVSPAVAVHDLHPAYLSTQYAARWDRRVAVQHHHAHAVSCAAEHGLTGPFLGVTYDGLGMGDDGTLWGGELLVADLVRYRRFARFSRAPLPGGSAAIRRPARMALGYLFGAERIGSGGIDPSLAGDFVGRLDPAEVAVVGRMVERRLNSPLASSAGRLFDAAAALLGLRDDASYEGEAAVALESAAAGGAHGELPWRLARVEGLWVYDAVPTLAAVLRQRAASVATGVIAARFHATVAAVTLALVERAAAQTGLREVCLSGGVFQNRLLAEAVLTGLHEAGLRGFVNQRVPCNDGGISYGQAAVAAARLEGR